MCTILTIILVGAASVVVAITLATPEQTVVGAGVIVEVVVIVSVCVSGSLEMSYRTDLFR